MLLSHRQLDKYKDEYYVYVLINNKPVPSSALYHGTRTNCKATADRLNRQLGNGTTTSYAIERCKP